MKLNTIHLFYRSPFSVKYSFEERSAIITMGVSGCPNNTWQLLGMVHSISCVKNIGL